MNPLKVGIDARLSSGEAGGVEQFIIGLASGLSKLTDGSEEYWFLAYADSKDWIRPFLGGACRIVEDTRTPGESLGRRILRQKIPALMDLLHSIDPRILQRSIPQEKSNGVIENAGIDVMHFTMQNAFLTEIPSIYHPHDLQHIHLPEIFSLRRRVLRDQMYRTFSEQASMVAAVSRFVKEDLIKNYQLPRDKVKVVPLAPVVTAYSESSLEDLERVRRKFSLPESFIFYPAQTWSHKNHIGLLNALALLRDKKHVRVDAVFSGRKAGFYKIIEQRVEELRLEDQVKFLDFVDPAELRSLYQLCRCVVIPTKFEAASFPLWEAFIMGVPAACSNVTSLPEQAGDAALLFDPDKPDEMACQIHKLWRDEKLRAELVEKGRRNVSRFSWERTARTFRAHYRRIAQRELSDEDKEILSAPSLF
jgi:glycosyltransferase involved in cell wall biosynthesis